MSSRSAGARSGTIRPKPMVKREKNVIIQKPLLQIPLRVKATSGKPLTKKKPIPAAGTPSSNNVEVLLSIPIVNEPVITKDTLPRLPYEIVLKILDLAGASKLEYSHLIVLRGIGKWWRLAIDNFHLPFSFRPASHWSPYLSDKVPQDALSRSPPKCLKFPDDIATFHELCESDNPFPSRELKIWCTSAEPFLINFRSLMHATNHVWSLTYVVGPSLESIELLYNMIGKMTLLEDLRVIDNNLSTIFDNIEKAIEKGENVQYPTLQICTPHPQLLSLSVTGSRNPTILDDILDMFGDKNTIRCLEVQGGAVKNSRYFRRNTDNQEHLVGIKKLKVCGADNEVISIFANYQIRWDVSHLSFHMSGKKAPLYISNEFKGWLDYMRHDLEELYLYFDHLMRQAKPSAKLVPSYGRLYELQKLSLPYRFAEWNCWDFDSCPNIQLVEYYDWNQTVNSPTRRANYLKITDKERSSMVETVLWRCIDRYSARQCKILYAKSEKNKVILFGENYDYQEDEDFDGHLI